MTKNAELLCPRLEKQTDPDVVLFVCTGNTCRSPMAAALFNYLYGSESRRATSAGLYAAGEPISKNAVAALTDRCVPVTGDNDYPSHVSVCVSEEAIKSAALVVGVTSSHAMQLIMRYPAYASKIAVMPTDISDPYGGDEEAYKRCLRDIEEALGAAFGQGQEAQE